MTIKKEIGTNFKPTKVIFATSSSSGGCNFNFDGGTKEPIKYDQSKGESFDSAQDLFKQLRSIPTLTIKKINKKSVTIEISEDCYSSVDPITSDFKNTNRKGKTYRIAFSQNQHLNFI